ncbi:hypothetical protein KRP22_008588 [Phytophthora ramorum]|uniref:uncharacterized protein n=1 Tax=Phytophthora ramorum TaxID=164328 RepID=UPI00309739DE|nr:hypothetical protein KRP23_2713 [Phytophthora ramorum]KAH7501947.1 hypothetical protein KRP22_7421 [Phytophthora ramorum]
MRLSYVFLVAVGALVASANALLPATTDQTASKIATPLFDGEQNNVGGRRFLRTGDAASDNVPNTEERRRLVNIDLILKDAAISVKKATAWKAQFLWWKMINKKPFTLAQELGISHLGTAMRSHSNWKKYVAYHEFYGKGPLRYTD